MIEKLKKNKIVENIIGILLIVPIDFVCIKLINLLSLSSPETILGDTILMYLPIVIGMIFAYIFYKDKINMLNFICIFIFLGIAITIPFLYHSPWDNLKIALSVFFINLIRRILSVILYKNIGGLRKAIDFVSISIIIFVLFLYI